MKLFLRSNALVIFFLMVFFLTSCSGYEEKDGEIYYTKLSHIDGSKIYSLIGADAASFSTIEHNLSMSLGKDKNHVFKDASILKGADPLTFEQIKEYYWKDKNHVFLLIYESWECIMEDVDPKTFQVIQDDYWARDKINVFHRFTKIENIDPNTFIGIDENWGKDKDYYYYEHLRLDSLDYESAEIVNSYYIKDNNFVFFENRIVKDANPLTFKADGVGSFGHDDRYMFSLDENKGLITDEYRKRYIWFGI